MARKLLVVAAVAAALIALLFAVAATRPAAYQLERSRTFAAPAAVVWATISDWNRFPSWSPWQRLDPAMRVTVEGTPGTVGHRYRWQGNGDAGAGSQTMTAVRQGERIDVALAFLEPWQSTATTWFELRPQGEQTTLAWGMRGEHDLMGKVMSLFMDFEAMIGRDYDAGLANLERVLATPTP
jgi:uncharacterized protein YndB with AHSA1/START domain